MKQVSNLILAAFLFAATSCGGNSGKEANSTNNETSASDEIKLKQYMVKGGELYATYCANCHQKEGTGLASLFPPLAKSDYLLSDLQRATCVIKNGLFDPITVNGQSYSQMMPANPQFSPLEVAEILTYITNSWGNNTGLSGVKEVEMWLLKCE